MQQDSSVETYQFLIDLTVGGFSFESLETFSLDSLIHNFFPSAECKQRSQRLRPAISDYSDCAFFFPRLSIKCDSSFCQQQRPNVSLTTAESVTKALTFLPVEEELSVIRVICYHCAVTLLWQLSRAPRKGQGLNEPLKQGSHRSLMDLFSCVSKY